MKYKVGDVIKNNPGNTYAVVTKISPDGDDYVFYYLIISSTRLEKHDDLSLKVGDFKNTTFRTSNWIVIGHNETIPIYKPEYFQTEDAFQDEHGAKWIVSESFPEVFRAVCIKPGNDRGKKIGSQWQFAHSDANLRKIDNPFV